jgi:hypothetical protein
VIEMTVGLVILIALLVALDLAAVLFGVDSRDGNDWRLSK